MLITLSKKDKYKNESQLGAHRAVRKGDYKLIISKMGDVEHKQLFNLKKDPFELNNLLTQTGFENKLTELEIELKKLIKETKDPAILNAPDFGLYSK